MRTLGQYMAMSGATFGFVPRIPPSRIRANNACFPASSCPSVASSGRTPPPSSTRRTCRRRGGPSSSRGRPSGGPDSRPTKRRDISWIPGRRTAREDGVLDRGFPRCTYILYYLYMIDDPLQVYDGPGLLLRECGVDDLRAGPASRPAMHGGSSVKCRHGG